MPVTQELIENGRILLVTFSDPWTAQEMVSLFPEARRFYDAAERPIHILIDTRRSKTPAPNALRARSTSAETPYERQRCHCWRQCHRSRSCRGGPQVGALRSRCLLRYL